MTAVADVINSQNVFRSICLMTGQTAAMVAPVGLVGVPNYPSKGYLAGDDGACFAVRSAEESTLQLRSTAGSGTMSATIVLWGYLAAANSGAGAWYPVSDFANVASMALVQGSLVPTQLFLTDRFANLGHYDRLYCQLVAVAGTATAMEVWCTTARLGM